MQGIRVGNRDRPLARKFIACAGWSPDRLPSRHIFQEANRARESGAHCGYRSASGAALHYKVRIMSIRIDVSVCERMFLGALLRSPCRLSTPLFLVCFSARTFRRQCFFPSAVPSLLMRSSFSSVVRVLACRSGLLAHCHKVGSQPHHHWRHLQCTDLNNPFRLRLACLIQILFPSHRA